MTADAMTASPACPTRGLLLAVVFVWLLASGSALAQQPTFRFNPPEGTTYKVTENCTYQVDFGWGETLAGQYASESEVAIERQAVGYRVTTTLARIPAAQGASPNDYVTLSRLKAEAEAGILVTYELDDGLRLVRLSGDDRIGQRFRQAVRRDGSLSEGARRVSQNILTKRGNLIAARDHWERAYASYLGQRAEMGSVWVTTGRAYCMSGEVAEFYTAMKVMGGQQVGGVACLRVEFQSAQDPADLRAFLGPYAEELLEGKTAFAGTAKVSETGYRLVDPSTMLTYGQEIAEIVGFHFPGPGMADAPVLFRVKTTYEYDYSE